MRRPFTDHLLPFAAPLTLLCAWQAAASLGWIDAALWSSPLGVLRAARDAAATPDALNDLAASGLRAGAGLLIGVPAGIVAGLALGLSGTADRVVSPTLNAIRQVALFSWVPLISVWLGSGEAGKIGFIAYAVTFPILLAAQNGVRSADPRLLEVGSVLALTRRQRLRRIVLPAALPALLNGFHLAIIYAWLAAIGAEYLFSAGPGVGSALMTARAQFRMDQVILLIAEIALVGLALNLGASRAERRILYVRGLA